MKKVKGILPAQQLMMGTTQIKQPLPTNTVRQIDPFLLLHHAGPFQIEAGENPMHVPPHPHRGFSPVTFVFDGGVEHKDSLGNHQIIRSGGIQWIDSGSGIVHSESVSEKFIKEGGKFQIIQLWINLPKSKKMIRPAYIGKQREEIPSFSTGLGYFQVVAGEINGLQGAHDPELPLQIGMGNMDEGDVLQFDIPFENSFIYILEGQLEIDGQEVNANQLALLDQSEKSIQAKVLQSTKVLFCAGDALNEPMAQYGPFVMNTQTEIMTAMRDYESGKMGVLED